MPDARTLAPLLSTLALSAALSLGACAGAPRVAPRTAGTAVAAEAGVSISVPRVEGSGHPDAPVKDSLAIYVVIENQGSQEIVITKEDFTIVAPGGERYAAICPEYLASASSWAGSQVRGRIVRATGFGETLYLPPSGLPASSARVSIDSLPDGTLGPGGRAAGYLYFARASAPPGQPFQLGWRVRDETSQQHTAELKVRLAGP